jgi:hypothetical protein
MTAVVRYKTSTKDNLIEAAEGSITNVLNLAAGTGGDETSDGMTANPETDTEDGFLTIVVNGTSYQIPIYAA